MNIERSGSKNKIDKMTDIHEGVMDAREAAIKLGGMAIRFANIERVPRYGERRENDAEHSFMLALIAPEIAAAIRPELDPGLISQFSTVHDLIELETGDVVTFGLTEEELTLKESRERQALASLLLKLPPHTATMLHRYEAQQEPEARFVRLLEKILPLIVNTSGSGKRVMQEDFGIEDSRSLSSMEDSFAQRLKNLFPDSSLEAIHILRRLLAQDFQNMFEQG